MDNWNNKQELVLLKLRVKNDTTRMSYTEMIVDGILWKVIPLLSNMADVLSDEVLYSIDFMDILLTIERMPTSKEISNITRMLDESLERIVVRKKIDHKTRVYYILKRIYSSIVGGFTVSFKLKKLDIKEEHELENTINEIWENGVAYIRLKKE